MKKILITLTGVACLMMASKAFAAAIYLNASAIRGIGVDQNGSVAIELYEEGFLDYEPVNWPRGCVERVNGRNRYNVVLNVNTPGGRSMYATILLLRALAKPSFWTLSEGGQGLNCTVSKVLAADVVRNPW